jgi:hypothetical protein
MALLVAAAVALVGCGSAGSAHSSGSSGSSASRTSSASSTSTGAAGTTSSTAGPPPAIAELAAAEAPRQRQFPVAHGRTLRQLAALASSSAQLGAATGTFVPGTQRLAFGLNTSSGAFIYAPTAVYVARTADSPAKGPFLAPADPMTVAPAYRSRQNEGPGGIQAIYAAQLPLPSKGTYVLLALTRTPHGLIGSPGEIAVAASSRIPDVGQRPPAIATDTLASVHGNVGLLTTRVPPDDMHAISFNQVLGKRPVALLFSTPQLCTSRVCGPVTDVVAALEQQFRDRITFIHEEVYVENQPTKGLRPQMRAFHLETEPWLFTISRRGIIAARLEGAFGRNEVRQALQAALR